LNRSGGSVIWSVPKIDSASTGAIAGPFERRRGRRREVEELGKAGNEPAPIDSVCRPFVSVA
jgi:hypothetical protein